MLTDPEANSAVSQVFERLNGGGHIRPGPSAVRASERVFAAPPGR